MKKTIKIKLVGFWDGFNPDNSIIFQLISKHFNIEYVDDDPEYIFCSVFADYEYCKYPQVRIMFSGENYIPDFNLIDYAISSYPLQLFDRHFRFFGFIGDKTEETLQLGKYTNNYGLNFVCGKKYFANFICSHESEFNLRGDFFKKLSQYKRVESCGSYLNNMENGFTVNKDNKFLFQQLCKFTICFESTSHDGFITEKIRDAFLAKTIPIYHGSSDVATIFNKEAFINCSDYDNSDEVIAKIIELDNDDEKYIEMINKPIFVDNNYIFKTLEGLEDFLIHIFDQPIEKAFRRSRIYSPKDYNDYLIKRLNNNSVNMCNHKNKKFLKLKKIKLKIKHFLSRFKFYQKSSRINDKKTDALDR